MNTSVHALAKELGVTSRQVLEEIRAEGEHITSPRSTVPDPIVRLLRDRHGVAAPPPSRPARPPYAPPPAFALRRPPVALPPPPPGGYLSADPIARNLGVPATYRRPRREWYRGEPLSPLLTLLLRFRYLKHRDPLDRIPIGTYYEDEVVGARRLAKDWSPLVFEMDLDEIERWLRIKPEVYYWTARDMSAVKITASEAQLSIWNGRSRADRPRLVDMVLVGDIEPVEAAAQLRAWREAGSPQYGSGA